MIVDRSIIFYDQLGCGQSTKLVGHPLTVLTKNDEANAKEGDKKPSKVLDVDAMVQDLVSLITHWKLDQFHLLGHSFGGILLFEYLKHCKNHPNTKSICRSATLASAPTSTQLVEEEVQRLCQNLLANSTGDDDYDDDEEGIPAGTLPKKVPKRFRETHECRMVPTPFPLMDSYSRVGPMKLRGLQSIGNYTAMLSSSSSSLSSSLTTQEQEEGEAIPPAPTKLQVPVLVLRGQHDFVTDKCVKDWDNMFQCCHYMTLAGCAHYGMLENEIMYGSVLSSFFADCDDDAYNHGAA